MDRRFSQVKPKDIARFWSKVVVGKPDECWEWQASCISAGYGYFSLYGFTMKSTYCMAHVFSYWLHNQEDPVGFVIEHTCDNPKCVNPKHLHKSTVHNNAISASERGLVNHGSKVWTAKLIPEQVVEIVQLLKQSMGCSVIAKKYGVHRTTIARIKAGKFWKQTTKHHGIDVKYNVRQ